MMIASNSTDQQSARATPPRRSLGRAPTLRYDVREFIEDAQHLLSVVGAEPGGATCRKEEIDGPRLVIQLALLLRVVRTARQADLLFSKKYGPLTGARRLTKFRSVLEFLAESRAEISRTGLADEHDPIAVCEEFVRFLLNRKLDPTQRRPPRRVLNRFLDDWGHRSM